MQHSKICEEDYPGMKNEHDDYQGNATCSALFIMIKSIK